jgi:hypothetical protein
MPFSYWSVIYDIGLIVVIAFYIVTSDFIADEISI